MPNISAEPVATSWNDPDILLGNQGGTTKTIPRVYVVQGIGSGIQLNSGGSITYGNIGSGLPGTMSLIHSSLPFNTCQTWGTSGSAALQIVYTATDTTGNDTYPCGICVTANSGYNGIAQNICYIAQNHDIISGAAVGAYNNPGSAGAGGFQAQVDGSGTSSLNTGVLSYARWGKANFSLTGICDRNSQSGGWNIAVFGFGNQTSGGTMVGGFFQVGTTTAIAPASCAVLAENAGGTFPLFLARRNATNAVQIDQSGNVIIISGALATHVRNTSEVVSGVRAVAVNQSGLLQVAMAGVSGRMPAVGVVMEAVASGSAANVYTAGAFQASSGMVDFSGYLGAKLWVGRSGHITTTSGAWSSGGFSSGDLGQYVGVPLNSGAILLTSFGTSWSGGPLGLAPF